VLQGKAQASVCSEIDAHYFRAINSELDLERSPDKATTLEKKHGNAEKKYSTANLDNPIL